MKVYSAQELSNIFENFVWTDEDEDRRAYNHVLDRLHSGPTPEKISIPEFCKRIRRAMENQVGILETPPVLQNFNSQELWNAIPSEPDILDYYIATTTLDELRNNG